MRILTCDEMRNLTCDKIEVLMGLVMTFSPLTYLTDGEASCAFPVLVSPLCTVSGERDFGNISPKELLTVDVYQEMLDDER